MEVCTNVSLCVGIRADFSGLEVASLTMMVWGVMTTWDEEVALVWP